MVKEILNHELLTRALGLLISCVVFLAGTVVTVSGYYLRSQYEAIETRQAEAERRIDGLATTESQLERTTIRLDGQLNGIAQQISDTRSQVGIVSAKLDRILEHQYAPR